MSDQVEQTVRFLPWEQALPDFGARPKNPFVPYQDSELEQSIPHRFAKMVKKHAGSLAVKDSAREFSYQGLNEMANRLAWSILSEGESGAPTAALLFEERALSIAALMGVIKAGKAYVPLDASYPRARLDYMLHDSQADLIVTDAQNLALAGELASSHGAEGRRVINMAELDPALPTHDPELDLSPDAYAYILYTSGTTGQPKGVLGSHRQVQQFCKVMVNAHHLVPEDRIVLIGSLSFSGSLTYIFPALCCGALLLPFDVKKEGVGRLADWLVEQRVTIYGSVPMLYRQMCATLDEGFRFPDLRTVRVGGDRADKGDLELYKKYCSANCVFRVGYGATEVKIISQHFMNHESEIVDDVMPVGWPVEDMEVLILDAEGQPVAPGEVGQVAVRSRYLAPGYWHKPKVTAAKFLPDPDGSEARIYLTGDLGRMSPNGCLAHMGRVDSQVKVRGYRIEIAEVEATLLDLEVVEQAAVVLHSGPGGDPELVAYLVSAVQPAPTVSDLRQALGERLPDYMIPAIFVMLDKMPLNANDKIDRRALPEPEMTRPELAVEYVAPRNEIERELVGIWEQVLGVTPIGVRDNFFELGGHSLLTVRLFADLQARFGRGVSLHPFFRSPTVEHLADVLREEQSQPAQPVTGRPIEDTPLRGLKNRLLQVLALYAPGAKTTRVRLHRWRGVQIGKGVFIGVGVILESAYPHLVSIGDSVTISVRSVVIGHFKDTARQAREEHRPSVRIENDVFIGPGVIILPNVTIGEGAVVAAGSVVNHSVPPQAMVQGNPAKVVALCGVPLKGHSYEEFMRNLQPVNGQRAPVPGGYPRV